MGMTCRRAIIVLMLAAFVLPVGFPPAGRAAPPRTVEIRGHGSGRLVLILERLSSGPTSYDLDVTVRPAERRAGGFATVDARVERDRIVEVFPGDAVIFDPENEPYVYLNGDETSTCDFGLCDFYCCAAFGASDEYDDKTGDGRSNRLFVALWAPDFSYVLQAEGWTLRTARWPFRFVWGARTKAIGVGSGSVRGAEVFMEATAPGGRHGSLAVAGAPCSAADVGFPPRGVGRATLEGGVEDEEVFCPTDGDPAAGQFFVSSWAPEATGWRFHGLVAGDTTLAQARLFVLDLPARGL